MLRLDLKKSIAIEMSNTTKSQTANSKNQVADNSTVIGSAQLEMGDALTRYASWQPPTAIVSDGAYGLGLFPSEPSSPTELADWYAPHIAAWSRYSLPETTLWFWCSEIGWATVHPVLANNGWQYRCTNIWDKGIGHIAGNVNSKTIRQFPIVTEVCVQYVRKVELPTCKGQFLSMQDWLRHEWLRTGLPLNRTNEACGLKNAATRKYFTKDRLWYFPPAEMMERIVAYANLHGPPTQWPYFSLDGFSSVTAEQWSRLRSKWNHIHGATNVWSEPAVRGAERLKDKKAKSVHANQKPLQLMERIILASSDAGDAIWEPFGGLCSAGVASLRKGRKSFCAEINSDYYQLAKARLEREYELCRSFLFPDFL
ncbi:MAG: DNA methyltransferase [Cyanobacteriota bacterium]|nr:DNA methyltransferase [Cyanobacteriota bacterium]